MPVSKRFRGGSKGGERDWPKQKGFDELAKSKIEYAFVQGSVRSDKEAAHNIRVRRWVIVIYITKFDEVILLSK